MDQSARWWSLLSDYVRSIKKCAAVASQLAEDGIPANALTNANASDENLAGIRQKPLQPMSLSKPVSPAVPALPPSNIRNSQTSQSYGSTSSLKFGATAPDTSVPSPSLPPRRPPAGPPVRAPVQPPQKPFVPPPPEQFASFPSQSQPASNPPAEETLPPEVLNPHADSDLPVTLQMEMALQAAVEDRKASTAARSSNPWGEDDSNVWG
jgi:hypothetical protein